MQEKFEEMQDTICSTMETGKVPEETRILHKGFNEWNTKLSRHDHQSIVEVGPSALNAIHLESLVVLNSWLPGLLMCDVHSTIDRPSHIHLLSLEI